MSELKPGVETTEWRATQWIKWGFGLAGVCFAAVTAILPVSGAVGEDSVVLVVLGTLSAVCFIVSGRSVDSYVASRAKLKALPKE